MSTEKKVMEYSRVIGDYIGIDRDIGDEITVECSNGSFSGEIYEVPDDVPTESGQTREVLATIDGSEDFVGLYCHVLEMRAMDVRYDVYAVRMNEDGSDENIETIQRIEITE